MFETDLSKEQAKLICEALEIDTLTDVTCEEGELLKEHNPELFNAYVALRFYAYN